MAIATRFVPTEAKVRHLRSITPEQRVRTGCELFGLIRELRRGRPLSGVGPIHQDLTRVLAAFEALEIEAVLAGQLAAGVHGFEYVIARVSFLVPPGTELGSLDLGVPGSTGRVMPGGLEAKVRPHTGIPGWTQLRSRSQRTDLGGSTLWITSPEDTILDILANTPPPFRATAPDAFAIARTQGRGLDAGYLRAHRPTPDVATAVEQTLEEAGLAADP